MDNRLKCKCGQVELELRGAKPILTALCYCDDCQEAGRRLEELEGAPPVLQEDGGTALVLWRKDRVDVSRGEELIEVHRLREDSPTDRAVAGCCNTAMYLNFRKGHWLSIYRRRFVDPPAIEVGIQTRFMEGFDEEASEVPTYAKYPLRFIGRVMKARVAMLLRR